MTSNLLNSMGLGNMDIGIVLIVMCVLLIAAIVLLVLFITKEEKLRKKYLIFMRGKEASSLEEDIINLYNDNKALKEKITQNRRDIKTLYKLQRKNVQKIGLVKYDAYQQMGGLLSFALVLLDEDNNGLVLNSVHSTEGCYTYIKDIKGGECELELGKEEKEALQQAVEEYETGKD